LFFPARGHKHSRAAVHGFYERDADGTLGRRRLCSPYTREVAFHMTVADTLETRLGAVCTPLTRTHRGLSGIVPLREGRDAFAARVLLADAAERTLDVQYYIWRNDMSGTLLLDALRRAANRGVHVRLLLDDNNTIGLDAIIAELDAHPNIEVRLFNPFRHRRWRIVDFITDFGRANRRMHNKSFTADNQVTIVGGRNVGDEYFDAAHDTLFVDLDVMAIGAVVNDVSLDFERYWTSKSALPAAVVIPPANDELISQVAANAERVEQDPAAQAYIQAIVRQPFVRDLLERKLAFEWAPTSIVSDDPAKGLGAAEEDGLVWTRLKELFGAPEHALDLVSPYFVPGENGVNYFRSLVARGVKVRVLTNSLEATDVAAVHAGYAKRRKPLLHAGVRLFEMKRVAAAAPQASGGSSGSSLHAKTFAIDRSRVFVGSFNFDPRSARLNTELGFVIDSGPLAQAIADVLAERVPNRAYTLGSSNDGALTWTEMGPNGTVVHVREPGTGFWLRFGVAVMSRLPIEWLL
jgi:cardiolipin synthase C